jgi:hypothetical protein
MLSMGPPKHAENPMMGAKTFVVENEISVIDEGTEWLRTATLMLATRSAREFPTAKIVKPMMASDSPKMEPKV